ncbi:12805_t:CDS:2, partial [Racocetra persica]
NELTESSFKTNDTIDLTESTPTETTVELTNTSEESDLNSVLLTSREPSWVWEHFSKEYNNNNEIISFIYTICKLKYKSINTPGTLAKHLHNKHSNYVGNRQSTLEKFIDKPYSKTDQRYRQLTDTIVDFIVCCQLPFSIVDNIYFITMLNKLDGRYQVPSLIQVLDQAKITKKLLGITTDNAYSMIAAGRELKETLDNYELVHQRCAAHILNIAIQHGLQLASITIKRVRDFVTKIRHSTRLSESLKTIYKLENKPELRPDLDIETR